MENISASWRVLGTPLLSQPQIPLGGVNCCNILRAQPGAVSSQRAEGPLLEQFLEQKERNSMKMSPQPAGSSNRGLQRDFLSTFVGLWCDNCRAGARSHEALCAVSPLGPNPPQILPQNALFGVLGVPRAELGAGGAQGCPCRHKLSSLWAVQGSSPRAGIAGDASSFSFYICTFCADVVLSLIVSKFSSQSK